MQPKEEEPDYSTCLFDQFMHANTFRTIISAFTDLCEFLEVKPNDFKSCYPYLKNRLTSWKAKTLWAKLDKKAKHKDYKGGKACTNTKVLIIGAGPCGLRSAIDASLLGAKVVVVEKRDRFSRNNVLHLWPYVIEDLRSLGAKKFYGKFCAGSIDHISIRQLQCMLLKVSLLFGVEVHGNTAFEGLIEPPENQEEERIGWRAHISPPNHPIADYEFDVLIGADGKRNTLGGFKRKEFRGKLAIAITANFVNRHTKAETRVEEISGVAYIFNQKFFKDLKAQTRIDLENIVYYKDETHYFVMTAKKSSLLEKGVLLQDYAEAEQLLCGENISQEALLNYAREAADFSTNQKLPRLDFALNHYGLPDVAMFDFTSMYAAENAARVVERNNSQLLVGLVGDSLLEPFWPTGSGCARGFLGCADASWMIRSWASGRYSPLEVLAERESIYRLLAQTTPENLNKDLHQYSVDPKTRYPNLNTAAVEPASCILLYDNGKDVICEEMLIEKSRPKLQRKNNFDVSASDDDGDDDDGDGGDICDDNKQSRQEMSDKESGTESNESESDDSEGASGYDADTAKAECESDGDVEESTHEGMLKYAKIGRMPSFEVMSCGIVNSDEDDDDDVKGNNADLPSVCGDNISGASKMEETPGGLQPHGLFPRLVFMPGLGPNINEGTFADQLQDGLKKLAPLQNITIPSEIEGAEFEPAFPVPFSPFHEFANKHWEREFEKGRDKETVIEEAGHMWKVMKEKKQIHTPDNVTDREMVVSEVSETESEDDTNVDTLIATASEKSDGDYQNVSSLQDESENEIITSSVKVTTSEKSGNDYQNSSSLQNESEDNTNTDSVVATASEKSDDDYQNVSSLQDESENDTSAGSVMATASDKSGNDFQIVSSLQDESENETMTGSVMTTPEKSDNEYQNVSSLQDESENDTSTDSVMVTASEKSDNDHRHVPSLESETDAEDFDDNLLGQVNESTLNYDHGKNLELDTGVGLDSAKETEVFHSTDQQIFDSEGSRVFTNGNLVEMAVEGHSEPEESYFTSAIESSSDTAIQNDTESFRDSVCTAESSVEDTSEDSAKTTEILNQIDLENSAALYETDVDNFEVDSDQLALLNQLTAFPRMLVISNGDCDSVSESNTDLDSTAEMLPQTDNDGSVFTQKEGCSGDSLHYKQSVDLSGDSNAEVYTVDSTPAASTGCVETLPKPDTDGSVHTLPITNTGGSIQSKDPVDAEETTSPPVMPESSSDAEDGIPKAADDIMPIDNNTLILIMLFFYSIFSQTEFFNESYA